MPIKIKEGADRGGRRPSGGACFAAAVSAASPEPASFPHAGGAGGLIAPSQNGAMRSRANFLL